MKTLRYEKGHTAAVTMTVSELRERLNDFPQDMPVLALWEGLWTEFRPDGFRVERNSDCHPDDAIDCLIIDVDQRHDHTDHDQERALTPRWDNP